MNSFPNENIPKEPDPVNVGLLDCADAAQYLNMSESFVRKAVASKRIPFVRLGSRTLFRRLDLDDWITNHLVPTDSETCSRASIIAARLRHEGRH